MSVLALVKLEGERAARTAIAVYSAQIFAALRPGVLRGLGSEVRVYKRARYELKVQVQHVHAICPENVRRQ